MKAKQILSLLLALAMVFALAACTTSPAEPKTDAPATETPKTETPADNDTAKEPENTEKKVLTVNWLEMDSTQVDVVENYVKPALAEAFPDITFEWTGRGNDPTVMSTLSAAGDMPDLWYCGGSDVVPLLAAGDILDMAPYLDESYFTEKFTNPAAVFDPEGHYYFAAPGQNAYYTPVFYYNTEIFEELGLQEPTSIQELVSTCQTLVDAGYIAITSGGWMSQVCLPDGILIGGDTDAYLELLAGKCDWDDERIVNSLKYLDELILMDAFTTDIANKDDATAQAEFQNKEAAMWLAYSWMNDAVTEENLGFVPGTFNFPCSEGHDYVQLTWDVRAGLGGGFCGNARYEDPELLVEVLKVILEAESQRHNDAGVFTNYKVATPAVASNPLEVERLDIYASASAYQNVMNQSALDNAAYSELTTLYSMLMADDDTYLTAQFIDDFRAAWAENTYVQH